jgi:hypothetical protein
LLRKTDNARFLNKKILRNTHDPRHRHAGRQTDRQTGTQEGRLTGRHRQTQADTGRHADTGSHGDTGRHRQNDVQARQAGTTGRHDRLHGRQARQIGRHTDSQDYR